MHPRPNYLRAAIDTKDMEVLDEIEPLFAEALEELRGGDTRKAQVLLETALCNPDPDQGGKLRAWKARQAFESEYVTIAGEPRKVN